MANMHAYLCEIQPDSTFFKAILNLHKENYDEAHRYISRTRELLDTELRALVRRPSRTATQLHPRLLMML